MTQDDAVRMSLAVTTAMLNGDKGAREQLYADLSAEDLRRVLRWTTRFQIMMFISLLGVTTGSSDPTMVRETWQQFCATQLAAVEAAGEEG